MPYDLVLSSGFLAFARHAGFLRAVEETGIEVSGICGTSSGALAGALWASGMDARSILTELTARAPLQWVTPHWQPWRGLFRLDAVIGELRGRVPATFAELDRPFGVGVATGGRHALLVDGDLPKAVAASCAVRYLFTPLDVAGRVCEDGGVVDRTALGAWRAHRPDAPVILHLIERTAGAAAMPELGDTAVVHSPPSGAKLWSLGDVEAAYEESRQRGLEVLVTLPR